MIVRKAYKRRALETHPDRNRDVDKEIAEERFRKVSMAYEVLSDPEKRKVCPRVLVTRRAAVLSTDPSSMIPTAPGHPRN
jgi:hypothetical protein